MQKQRFVVEDADISQMSQFEIEDGRPVFSTPLRASFRQRRPRTMIEGVRTPIKAVEGKRWSNIELAQLQDESYVTRVNDRSQVPEGIDPSMVAVWSQFVNYEATIPEISPSIPVS